MPFSNPLRDRVALAEAGGFGLLSGIFALGWPWPWLAPVAGLAVAAVVLPVATWHQREQQPRPEPPMGNIEERARAWARKTGDDARDLARQVVNTATNIVFTEYQCKQAQLSLDEEAARAESTKRVQLTKDFVDTHQQAPETKEDWERLAEHLQEALNSLTRELERLTKSSEPPAH